MEPYKYVSISKWIDSQHKIRAAVHLADLGIPVFSCKPDKSPNTPHGFKDATTDQQTLVGMFAQPDLRIGMPTGRASGLTVVDIDPKNGGDKSVGNLNVPSTRTAKTPSGGVHFYFKDAGIRSSASSLAPGVDIRGEGGYVLVPPSKGYKWLNDDEPADYPPHLIPGKKRGAALKPTGLDIEAIRNGIPAGQRNDLIFRGLCQLRHFNKPIEEAKEWAADAAMNSTPAYDEVDTDEMAERVYAQYGPGEDFVTPEEKAEQERQERADRADKAWENPEVQKISKSPNILERFMQDLRRAGAVGEDRQLKLLFVAGHSRLLDRPISVVVKGPSSVGKSFAIDNAVLKVQPDEAYHYLTGMSERSLIHTDKSFQHRMLVIPEQSGIDRDYFDYLIRTLLSEGKIKYEVTEKEDGRLVTVEKEKDGPTGLILSTTKAKLHKENETRYLSIWMTDTKGQTKAIMKAIARAEAEDVPVLDAEPWKRYATWLSGQDNRVWISFAEEIEDGIEAYDERQRRDITLLFNTIRTLAIMHQARRKRDRKGRIIAELRDYEMARDLLNEAMSAGIGATVKKNVRDTVNAVRELTLDAKPQQPHTTNKALERYLDLSKGAVSTRVAAALSDGYIINVAEEGSKANKLALGAEMPDDKDLLPEPEEVLKEAIAKIGSIVRCFFAQYQRAARDGSLVRYFGSINGSMGAGGGDLDRGSKYVQDLRDGENSAYLNPKQATAHVEERPEKEPVLGPRRTIEQSNQITKSPDLLQSPDSWSSTIRTIEPNYQTIAEELATDGMYTADEILDVAARLGEYVEIDNSKVTNPATIAAKVKGSKVDGELAWRANQLLRELRR
jgi:hypothetical protein